MKNEIKSLETFKAKAESIIESNALNNVKGGLMTERKVDVDKISCHEGLRWGLKQVAYILGA